ncbi:MAG: RNA-directed DNA polymerase [bacterium]|nr:RNA-directed DNA polymerase [bacterium]
MKLNLENALGTILDDDFRGDNPIPDALRFSYTLVKKDKFFGYIESLLRDQNYKAKPLLAIDVPKSNFTIRPMGRPEIQDWIIYQAIIDFLIPKIINKLSARSYSKLRFQNPERKTQPWIKFDAESRNYYNSGFKHVVVTDISSYFENIDLEELRRKILNYNQRSSEYKEVVDFLLIQFLKPWSSGRVRGFGLPQGPTASSFLGDVYLDSIDKEMEEERGYLRYMDDIRIFCKKEINAKKALIKLVKALRRYRLNINAKKTRILAGEEVSKYLFDPKKPLLDAIQSAFDSRNRERINAIVPILVNDVLLGGFLEENQFNQRHINFAIFRLSILKTSGVAFNESRVVRIILDNFIKQPQNTNTFCSFLALFPGNNIIERNFLKFLQSENNIYEWQELHILRALLEMKIKLTSPQIGWFWKRLNDKNLHWSLRSMYSLLVGKCGSARDRDKLIDLFDNTENNEFLRSLTLSVQELGVAARNDFYNDIRSQVLPPMFVNYVKSLERPTYFMAHERVTIKRFEEAKEKYY